MITKRLSLHLFACMINVFLEMINYFSLTAFLFSDNYGKKYSHNGLQVTVRRSTWFYPNTDTNNFVIVTDTNTGCYMKIKICNASIKF